MTYLDKKNLEKFLRDADKIFSLLVNNQKQYVHPVEKSFMIPDLFSLYFPFETSCLLPEVLCTIME